VFQKKFGKSRFFILLVARLLASAKSFASSAYLLFCKLQLVFHVWLFTFHNM